MNRGQMFGTDILIAVIIFVFILVAIVWLFDITSTRTSSSPGDYSSMAVATALIATPGNPSDWHNSGVINSIGLAESYGVLEYDKIIGLYGLSYQDAKSLLTAGQDFYLTFQKPSGWLLDGFFTGRIAYTYAEGNPDEGNESSHGLRHYLDSNQIPYVNYHDDWESMLQEIDNYDVIIMEDPQLREKDLSSGQSQTLLSWVSDGNTLFQKQYGRIIEMFGVTTNNVAHEWGDVVAVDGMLENVQVGDEIRVQEGYRISKQGNITKLVEHEPSDHGLICYWQYGQGKVFYMPDTEGQVVDINGTVKYNNTQDVLRLPSYTNIVQIGKIPKNASRVFVVEREALVDSENVKMRLSTWQRE